MRLPILVFALACSLGDAALLAAETPAQTANAPTVNKTTIMAADVLSPGQYTSSLSPNINGEMARRIEKSIASVPGVDKVTADPVNSAVHFSIKAGSHVVISDLEQAAAKADHGVVISMPVLEHSEAALPGL